MFETIVKFFKTRLVSAKISPEIKIDYDRYDDNHDANLALKKEWEGLRKEIDLNPSSIKKQDWQNYRRGMKQEILTVEIEGVLLELEGPYYPDPDYKMPIPESQRRKTEEEIGNEGVDAIVGNYQFIQSLTHCSQFKFNTLIAFIEATRASRPKDC